MKNRIGLKTISILLGLFAWGYVNLAIPPQTRRTISTTVEYRNQTELVRVSPVNPTIIAEVEGTRRDFILSGEDKIQASVDLYNIRPGRALLPVRVTPSAGLNVVSVEPAQIQVEVITLIKKSFDVMPRVTGTPIEGYIAEMPVIDPASVTVTGTEADINQITQAHVQISVDQLRNSISEQRQVLLTPDAQQFRNPLIVTPKQVSVDITVKEGYPTKIVPLASPEFLNRLPEGKRIQSHKLIPTEVEITGPARHLNQVNELKFDSIDLAKLARTASIPLKLQLPGERMKLVEEINPVIEVNIIDVKVSRTLTGLNFDLEKAPNQHASVSVSSYSLEIEGYVHELDKIRNSQLKMVLDARNMKPGSYNITLSAPQGLGEAVLISKIIPETVTIQVSQLMTPPDEIRLDSSEPDVNSASQSAEEIEGN